MTDPQFAQWLRSFDSLMKRKPTQAEIAAYKLAHGIKSRPVLSLVDH